MTKEDYRNFLVVVSIVSGFVLLVGFISYYIKRTSNACFVGIPLWIGVISISFSGLFLGSFIYYIFIQDRVREKSKLNRGIMKTLLFLESSERKIIKALIMLGGETTQKKICQITGLDKVKISRILDKLERKGLIVKEKYGMTNKIIIDKDLKELFKDIKVSKNETNL